MEALAAARRTAALLDLLASTALREGCEIAFRPPLPQGSFARIMGHSLALRLGGITASWPLAHDFMPALLLPGETYWLSGQGGRAAVRPWS